MNDVIIRQIKIDFLTDSSNEIIDWFNELWHELSYEECNIYSTLDHEVVFYNQPMDSKKYIFYWNKRNSIIICDYHNYWSKMINYFNLTFNEAVDISKFLIGIKLNHTIGEVNYMKLDAII